MAFNGAGGSGSVRMVGCRGIFKGMKNKRKRKWRIEKEAKDRDAMALKLRREANEMAYESELNEYRGERGDRNDRD
jgi:hypothetical protein